MGCVMSRERELLKKALDFMLDAGANLNPLFKEINDNLLAQPEQRLTPLTSKLISLGNNCHESFIKGVRFAEKMHGIGGGE